MVGPVTFSQALEHVPLRQFQVLTVGLVTAALVIDGLDYQSLALLAPVIIEEWRIDRGAFGMAMAAALFGMAIGAAGGGMVGDRIGRLRALVMAVLVFGLATVATGLVDDVPMLTACRVIGGIGFGAAGPNAIALATEWLPMRYRTYVISLLAIGTPGGGMIGSLAIPAMLPSLGWRGVFAALGVMAVLLALLLAGLLRESPVWLLRKGRRSAASAAARRVVPLEIELGGEAGDQPEGARRGGLFTRSLLGLNCGIGLSFAALSGIVYGLGSWMPSFLTAAGFTLDQALRASLAFSSCSILGALVAGWAVRVAGSRRIMLASALLASLLLAGFGLSLENLAGAPGLSARFWIDGLAGAVGLTVSIAVTTLYAMAALLYPPEVRSSGIGIGMTAGRVGGIAMSYAGGYLLDYAGGSAIVLFGVLACCGLLATSAVWFVRADIRSASSA